jgi:hypothetical protein
MFGLHQAARRLDVAERAALADLASIGATGDDAPVPTDAEVELGADQFGIPAPQQGGGGERGEHQIARRLEAADHADGAFALECDVQRFAGHLALPMAR